MFTPMTAQLATAHQNDLIAAADAGRLARKARRPMLAIRPRRPRLRPAPQLTHI